MSKQQTISQLAKALEAYWGGRSVGGSVAGTAGAGVTDHHQLTGLKRDDHPHYLTAARGNALYVQVNQLPSFDITGGDGIDVATGNVVSVDLVDSSSHLEFVSGELQATWTVDGSTDFSHLLAVDSEGGTKVVDLEATTELKAPSVDATTKLSTPLIVADDDLTLTPTGDILTDNTLSTTDWASGVTGAGINFDTGVADFRTITADELIVEAFIAAVKRAHVGALIVTKSMSLTTREFTIPGPGDTGTIYVADIPGFGGMDAFEDGDDVSIQYMSLSEPYRPQFLFDNWGIDSGTGGATVYYGPEAFGTYSAGDDPTDWYDTGVSNATTLSDLWDVQSVGSSLAFGTTSSGSNFHTHWNGTGHATLTNYQYSGRFRIGGTSAGIGFTLFSKYASGGTDEYYRIRRYAGGSSFYVANHGDYEASMTGGTTSSGYNPTANVWHQFKIEAENTGTQTEIRAKFWLDGNSEPSAWQIDCYDSSTNRGTAGTFGQWGYSDADGAYVDDIEIKSLTGSSSSATVGVSTKIDDVVFVAAHAPTASTMTAPTGWTLIDSQAYGTSTIRWYRKTATGTYTYDTWGIDTGILLVHMVGVRYLDTSDIVETSSTGSFSDVSSFATPNLSLGNDNSALMIFTMNDEQLDVTAPDGMNSLWEPSTDDSKSAILTQIVDSGATGTRTVGYGANTSGAYMIIALNPKSGTREGLVIGTAWGKVEPNTGVTLEGDEQAWDFTTNSDSSGEGETVTVDSVVLDYGTDGDGYVEITTLDPSGSPYMQIATRGENPKTEQTVQLRAGNLDGIAGADGTWGLYVGGDTGRLELSDETFELREIPIRMFSNTLQTVRIGADGVFYLGTDVSDADTISFSFIPSTGFLRIGDSDAAGNRVTWNQTTGTLSVTGQIEVEAGSTGYDNLADGTTYGKIRNTIIGGGYIQIGASGQTVDVDLDGWHFGASEIVGQLDGDDQVTLNTSGQIVAGGGDVWLDEDGLSLMSGSSTVNSVNWMDEESPSTVFASVEAANPGGVGFVQIGMEAINGPKLLFAYESGVTSAVTLYGQIDDGFKIAADVLPYSDSTYDIGSTTMRWANAYADEIDVSGQISGVSQIIGEPSFLSTTFTTHMISAAYANGGGSATFTAEGVSSTQVNFINSSTVGQVRYVVRITYVIVSDTDSISGTVSVPNDSTATTATVNGITVTIGVSSTGRLYVVRASGTETFDITMDTVWR